MPFLLKKIKPGTLKKDAFRLEFLSGLHETERGIIKNFKETTKTWTGAKPEFDAIITLQDPGPALFVGPTGNDKGVQKYRWLNDGTRKNYPIPKYPKKGGKRLAFMTTGFSPKTRVRTIGSTAGSKAGPPMAFPVQVIHPGIEAREFDNEIGKLWKPRFKKIMQEALKRGVKKSGHALASV
jgi:hypothetical protein